MDVIGMPYILEPPRNRLIDRVTWAVSYLVMAVVGGFITLFDEAGLIAYAAGGILVVSGIIASLGAIFDHYQIEWGAVLPVFVGNCLLAVVAYSWAKTQAPEAIAVLGLSVYAITVLLNRWNRLNSIAAKDRALNKLRN